MKNLLTVREHEKIFVNNCPHFDEMSKFVEAGDYLNLGWQRNGGAFVQAKNFVGVIRLPDGFQVEILPKLNAPEEKLRGLVVEMIRTLKNFAGKKFLDAELDMARLPLYEIFIRAYLEMVLELVKRGLRSSYTLREENLNFLKGKLLVGRHVRKNFAHGEKFSVQIFCVDLFDMTTSMKKLLTSTAR